MTTSSFTERTKKNTTLSVRKDTESWYHTQCSQFGKTVIKFLGYVIDKDGIHPDPEKTKAITEMKPPASVSKLRRFMGMINQMGKFSPNLAEHSQPLRELLGKKRAWIWGPAQDQAFTSIKDELSSSVTLSLYHPEAETKISADASSHGLGAVLLQKIEGTWKPIAFASRSLSDTEKRYAQIEKEALASTWACEHFDNYILGKHFLLETDHKPLLSSKDLDNLPPRILRFRLRMMRFEYSIVHVPGKYLYTADALSRAPRTTTGDDAKESEVER